MEKKIFERVFVTGAGGFIGSHLVERLAEISDHVTALIHYDSRPHWGNLEYIDRKRFDSIEVKAGDITDPYFLRSCLEGVDCVFHLAALISIPFSYHAPEIFFRTNVLGTVNVLEACRMAKVKRIVTVSTSECYGTAQTVPMSEEHPLQAQSPYSASKIGADKAVESYHRSFDLPVVIVRPFNTYGPRQSARAIIPTIITQVLSNKPTIRLGSLNPVRDLTYVGDTVEGMIAAGRNKGVEGETFNLGTGRAISIGNLVEMIFNLTGREKEIELEQERIRPEKSEVMKLISDHSKATRILNWEPRIKFDEGLQRTIQFIMNHPEFYKTGRYLL